MGVIFAKKTTARKTRTLPPRGNFHVYSINAWIHLRKHVNKLPCLYSVAADVLWTFFAELFYMIFTCCMIIDRYCRLPSYYNSNMVCESSGYHLDIPADLHKSHDIFHEKLKKKCTGILGGRILLTALLREKTTSMLRGKTSIDLHITYYRAVSYSPKPTNQATP